MKFRLKTGKGSVQEFADANGTVYKPGGIVDLPASYEGEAWLERVDPVPVVAAVPGSFEPIPIEIVKAPADPLEAPLEASKTWKKRVPKKSES